MTYPSVTKWTPLNHLRSVAGPCRLCGRFLATNHEQVGEFHAFQILPLPSREGAGGRGRRRATVVRTKIPSPAIDCPPLTAEA